MTDDLHIEPDIRHLAVPIDSLKIDQHQSRTHGPDSIAEIRRSFERHGQKVPLVVQRDGLVTKAGHGRIMAARELGWTHLAVVKSDDAPELLREYAIRDNRSAEKARWDIDALAREIGDLGLDAVDVGFTEEDLADPMSDTENADDVDLGMEDFDPGPPENARFIIAVPVENVDAFRAAFRDSLARLGAVMRPIK